MKDYLFRAPASYSRSGSASSNYTVSSSSQGPSLPSKSVTPISGEKENPADSIRCSDCGNWVELMLMGEHTCATTGGLGGAEKRRRPDMKVDTSGLGPRDIAFGGSLSAKSPLSGDPLGPTLPLTPSSQPDWPSFPIRAPLARSVSGDSTTSSASSSRLPFLQRYQQLVGTIAAGSSMTLSRTTSAASNLVAFSFTPPPTPGQTAIPLPLSSSPSPLPTSSVTSGSFPRNISSSGSSLRAVSPEHSHDGSQRSSHRREGGSQRSTTSRSPNRVDDAVGSFMTSSSPPRSRKITLGERVPRDADQFSLEDYDSLDRRATIKGSHSTPAQLSSYSTSPTSYTAHRGGMQASSGTRASRERKGSAVGLDACLEDLRIMGLDEEDGGGSSILDDFFGSDGGSDGDMDELALTPRPIKRGTLPYSRSTPSIPSASMSASTSMSSALNRGTGEVKREEERKCTTCRRMHKEWQIQRAGDGQVFCRPCYADRFLPKCRKCLKAIEGGAVTSSDGKVTGKYHPDCFSCFTCSAPFPNKEFYVFDQKPYCQQHYHELNGSLCTDKHCGNPIEGPCVSLVGEENGGGGRYHPACFKCAHYSCGIALLDHHFVASKLPYCERHANASGPRSSRPGDKSTSLSKAKSGSAGSKAKKRMTIITRR